MHRYLRCWNFSSESSRRASGTAALSRIQVVALSRLLGEVGDRRGPVIPVVRVSFPWSRGLGISLRANSGSLG